LKCALRAFNWPAVHPWLPFGATVTLDPIGGQLSSIAHLVLSQKSRSRSWIADCSWKTYVCFV